MLNYLTHVSLCFKVTSVHGFPYCSRILLKNLLALIVGSLPVSIFSIESSNTVSFTRQQKSYSLRSSAFEEGKRCLDLSG